MTSYNGSGKLSKLAARGVIEKFTVTGDYRHRWRVKPEERGIKQNRATCSKTVTMLKMVTDGRHPPEVG